MINAADKKTRRTNFFLVAVCVALLAGIYFLTVAADRQTLKQLEKQISETSRQSDREKILLPVLDALEKNQNMDITGENKPVASIPLSESAADDYSKTIETLVRQCDLEQIAMSPDIQSILSDNGYIMVDLTTRGDFSNFKHLILQLGRLPYLSEINRFWLAQGPVGTGLEMSLRLRIQLTPGVDDTHENQ